MYLLWVTGLALFVLLEKTVPGGRRLTRVAGAVLMARGAWLLLEAAIALLPHAWR